MWEGGGTWHGNVYSDFRLIRIDTSDEGVNCSTQLIKCIKVEEYHNYRV